MAVKVGQRVVRKPVTLWDYDDRARRTSIQLRGVVVYVHPRGRYHTVAFDTPRGKICESFPGAGE